MKQILLAYDLHKENYCYNDAQQKQALLHLANGDTGFFDIVTWILQRGCISTFFIYNLLRLHTLKV